LDFTLKETENKIAKIAVKMFHFASKIAKKMFQSGPPIVTVVKVPPELKCTLLQLYMDFIYLFYLLYLATLFI